LRADRALLGVIALGGMLGAAGRFLVGEAIPNRPGHFPWGTFWVNASGSFLLGFLLVLIAERLPESRYVRPFVASGVLGAFTTMSTFLVEVCLLAKDGHAATAAAYSATTLVAGVALAALGVAAARRIAHPGVIGRT
jgi:CrcB protein